MIRALIDNGYNLTVVISNLSERDISSKAIEERLSNRYKGARFFVRKHPSLLNKAKKGSTDYKKYRIYLLTLLWDKITFGKYKVSNYRLMPYNIRDTLHKILEKESFDLVYSNYLYNFQPFLKSFGNDVVCDIHDYQYRRIENDVIPESSYIDSKLYSLFFKKSELKALKKIDRIISISPIESQMIREDIGHKNVYTIPATAEDPHSIDSLSYKYDLAFIGSNSDANRDSIVWFLDQCFENIVNEKPRIKLLIQGRITRNKLVNENDILKKYLGRNIIVKDFVENLSDVYQESKIMIAPVVKGSGMKIKVIEALSYKKPIIGTDIAFEGINIEDGINGIVANTIDEFSNAVINLLDDKSKIKLLKEKAYLLYQEEHSFESCVNLLQKIVEK